MAGEVSKLSFKRNFTFPHHQNIISLSLKSIFNIIKILFHFHKNNFSLSYKSFFIIIKIHYQYHKNNFFHYHRNPYIHSRHRNDKSSRCLDRQDTVEDIAASKLHKYVFSPKYFHFGLHIFSSKLHKYVGEEIFSSKDTNIFI